jgi:hypothetical protein
MTPAERQTLISKYKAGYDAVIDSLRDFPNTALTSHPIEGKWSACEIVHHLADSETTSAIRLRKLLTEDHAAIQGYDEAYYAIRFKYNERDFGPALEAFHAARANTAQILDQMADDDWTRAGTHTESGRYSVEDWLSIYAAHAHNHAAQIRRLRDALNS